MRRKLSETIRARTRKISETLKQAKVKEYSRRVAALVNAGFASDLVRNLDRWLGHLFNEGVPSVYDRAVDHYYNLTHIGGGTLHRIVDKSHTLWDMWEKVSGALQDDSFLQEVWGYFAALGKDLSSHAGIPLFGMSLKDYHTIADFLQRHFHLPREWLADMISVNAAELFGATVATLAALLNWKNSDTEKFCELAGSFGVSALFGANPILGVVATVMLAKALYQSSGEQKPPLILKALKGGAITAVFVAILNFAGYMGVLAISAVVISLIAWKFIKGHSIKLEQVRDATVSAIKKALKSLGSAAKYPLRTAKNLSL